MTAATSTLVNVLSEFRSAMREAGIPTLDDIFADGQLQRFHVEGDKPGSRNGWYVLHDDYPPAGAFGSWRTGVEQKWCLQAEGAMSEAEHEQFRQKVERTKRLLQEQEKERHAEAQERAAYVWENASPAASGHPYLQAKSIQAHGIRQDRGQLLIPVYGADGILRGLQYISEDGDKRFQTGTEVKGGYCPIGEPGGTLIICEGYATGASIHEATGHAVAVAFNCYNLKPVAQALQRKLGGDVRIIIAADDDRDTQSNPGVASATSAARGIGGLLAVPAFAAGEAGSDFNDLANLRGFKAVVADIEAAERGKVARNGASAVAINLSDDIDLTDDGLALKLGERWTDARHVAAWNQWLFFKGSRWVVDECLEHMMRGRDFLRKKAEALEEWAEKKAESLDARDRESFLRGARGKAYRLRSAHTVVQVVGLARSNEAQAAEVAQWDRDPWLLGTPGGTVDLRTGIVRDARQEDYITKATAVAPALQRTPTPLWAAFLKRIMGGNEEQVGYLQRFAGYALTGSIQEHAFVFGHGTGANGKGVFTRTLQGVLGDYALTVPTEMLMVTRNERHPTELARLRGVRLAIGSETEVGKTWAEARIKSLTGGDRIAARFMRQDFFEFDPEFKLLVVGNHKPSLRGVDEAIRRRLHLVPFTVNIPAAKQDPKLSAKLKNEWPGILRWAIDGCLQWQEEGLNPPPAILEATDQYLVGEDAVGQWLEECTRKDANGFSSSRDLYNSWKQWAEANGEFLISRKRLGQELTDRGYHPHRQPGGGARGYVGLTLVQGPS